MKIPLHSYAGMECTLSKNITGTWAVRDNTGTVLQCLTSFEARLVEAALETGMPMSRQALADASNLLAAVDQRLRTLDYTIANFEPAGEYGVGFANGLRWARGVLAKGKLQEPLDPAVGDLVAPALPMWAYGVKMLLVVLSFGAGVLWANAT